jgi:hypothetical protein
MENIIVKKRNRGNNNTVSNSKRGRYNKTAKKGIRFNNAALKVRTYEVEPGSRMTPVVSAVRKGRIYKNVPIRSEADQAETLATAKIVGDLSSYYNSPEHMKQTAVSAHGIPNVIRPNVVRAIDRAYGPYQKNLLREEAAARLKQAASKKDPHYMDVE